MNNAQPTLNDASPHANPHYTEPMEFGGVEIRPLDLLEHVLATGGTGSGKTRSFLLPLTERVLTRFGTEPAQRAAMILIDAKGDMAELATECVRRSGRGKDLYILGEGGNCWFSLFEQFHGDPTLIANFLFETLEDRSGGGRGANESFWEENAKRLLRAGVICAKALHGIELGGLEGISTGINLIASTHGGSCTQDDDDTNTNEDSDSVKVVKRLLNEGFAGHRLSLRERDETMSYVRMDVVRISSQTWGTISNMTRNYITQFSLKELQELFNESQDKRKLRPEDLIDDGLLLIVNLSPVIYGSAAAPFRMAIKKAFFDRILQRNHLVTRRKGHEVSINQIRPILVVMDEFHTTLDAKGRSSDAYFLDRAREFRSMCILATQGISAISSVIQDSGMRDHLLNNCRTKFFFGNDCPQTSEYFEYIGGMEDKEVESVRHEAVPAPPRFRLPNYVFADAPSSKTTVYGTDLRRQPRFPGSDLGGLPNGSALVVAKGRRLLSFKMDPPQYASGSEKVPASY